jgi:hypothetical protein
MVDMGARRRQRVSKCRSAGGPELFLVDPVPPFDLAVLLGAAGLDVPMSDPHGLNGAAKANENSCPLSLYSFWTVTGNARQISVKKARLEVWCNHRSNRKTRKRVH